MSRLTALLALVLCCCIGFLGYEFQAADDMRIAGYALLAVTDKAAPIIESAHGGAQAAEEWQAEQDRLAAEAQIYYAPQSYYDPEYDSMTDQEYIAWRESGWDYDARNGRYIGKYQMDESRLNGDWSPENQEAVAEQYMLDRYGSWENARAFWDANGWW